MSTTIDQRVVEMRFDNQHFEKNVSTTMSTLDKLKQKLNLSGASRGLESIDSAARKVNMTGLGNAVDTVTARFSALQVMGVTALANITNSAVNAGKSIVKSLTIDPVKTGFEEYETKMGSIQTILANTEHQGTTLNDVTSALEELNLYADKTIYNFQQMTRNIGTFTAAGVDLDTSVKSIQGIANLAAVSGSTSQQASTAMYQLSQALATGTVKLMDWNSVVNAGMGGKVFQNALIQTAAMLDGAANDVEAWQKKNIDAFGSFRDSLTQGEWLTGEVLTRTLQQFTMAAEEGSEEWEKFKKSLMDDGYTEAQAEGILKMANTATDAATKVKTFTQLMDTLKESAQSGWAQTWELLIGDFEEAKSFFTELSDLFGGILGDSANRRNGLLSEAMSSNWDKLIGKINEAGIETDKFEESIRNTVGDSKLDKLIQEYGSLEEVIRKGKVSSEDLNKALDGVIGAGGGEKFAGFVEGLEKIDRVFYRHARGDDVKAVQQALQELGYDLSQYGVDGIFEYETANALMAFQKDKGLKVDGIVGPETLAALKEAGTSVAELTDGVDDLKMSASELIDEITKKSGRELLLGSLMNIIKAIQKPLSAVGEAFRNTFSISPKQLYGALEGLNKFTDKFVMKGLLDIDNWHELVNVLDKLGISSKEFKSALRDALTANGVDVNKLLEEYGTLGGAFEKGAISADILKEALLNLGFSEAFINGGENADKLKRAFEGLFAVFEIIGRIAGGGLRVAFDVLTSVLGAFDMNVLDLAASMGDTVVAFRDWIVEGNMIAKMFDALLAKLPGIVDNIKQWFAAFKETPAVQKLVTAIEAIRSAFDDLTSGKIDVSEFARQLGTNLGNALKSLPEIAIQIGSDFIAGFVSGIGGSISGVISDIVNFCMEFVGAFASALGVQSPSWKAHDIATDFFQGFINGVKEAISGVIGVLKKIGEQIVKVFKSLWDTLTDESGNIEWEKLFAGGVLIAMAWFLKQLATAFTGIAEGIGGLGDLLDNAGDAVKKFGKVLNAYSWDLKASALQKLAISIGILVASVWVLAQIKDPAQLWNAVGVIVVLAGVVVGLAFAMDAMSKASIKFDGKKGSIEGLKTGLMQIGIVLLLLAATVKLIGSMDPEEAKQGFIRLAGLAVGLLAFVAILGAISLYAKDVDKFSGLLGKLAFAMMLMVAVLKMVDWLSAEEMLQGAVFVSAFTLFIAAIAKITKKSDGDIKKLGRTMIALTVAIGLMVGVCKLVSGLSPEEMLKGAAFAGGFALFVKALIWSTKVGTGQELAKVGGMVLSVSFSLMLMVGVCKIVGKLTGEEMVKGALFVGGFTLMLKALIGILKIGNDAQMAKVTGTILAMSVAVAILAAVAVALSFVPLGGLAKGVAAVGLLGLVMMGMIKALKGAQNVQGSIMMMAIAIGVMAAAIGILSFIDPKDLASAAGALAVVMGMFALIEKCSKSVTKSILSIGVMVVAVGLLAGILYLLTNNIGDPNAAIKSAVALGILMGALALSLKIVGASGPLASAAIGPMYAMVGVLALVAVIMGLLSKFDVEPSIETATSLSIMLLALAGVTAVLTLVGAGAPAALGGIAAFAIVVAGVGAIMLALAGLNKLFPGMQDWLDTGIVLLEKIGNGIGKFVGGLIGGIGEGMMDSLLEMVNTFKTVMERLAEVSEIGATVNLDGFTGVEKLIEVMGSIGLTTVGTTLSDIFTLGGTSMEKFQTDGVAFFTAMKEIAAASAGVTVDEASIDTVIGVAERLAALQSSLDPIGGVISWFTGRDDLATFGINVGEFISSMVTALGSLYGFQIDNQTFDELISAATSLSSLQSSLEPIGGVISWFTGRDDLGTFGLNAGLFIGAMKTALGHLDGFTANTEALDPIITASQSLAGLQTSLEPIGGVISWFTGRDDLGTFGVSVGAFISSMKTALSNLEGATLDKEALTSVIDAATALSKLQNKLEPMGGVVSWFTGRTDLGTFGTNIGLFGDAIGKLRTGMGETGIGEDAIASITNAGTAIIELQKALPEEGWFDGKMNLTEFADYITDFGTAMGGFGETAAGIDSAAVSMAITTAQRIRSLIESLVGLDTSGMATFTGIGTGGFGADGAAYKIGKTIAKYSEEVAGIDTAAVSTSVTAAMKLKSLIAGLVGLDTTGIENFKVDSIGSSMKGYADKVAGIDTGLVSSSISAANRLKIFIAGLAGLDTSGIINFKAGSIGSAIKSYGESVSGVNIGAIAQSISVATRIKNFIASLSGLNTSGVGSFASAVNELSTVNVGNLVKAFSGASTKLVTAGADMINGLVRGMQSKMSTVNSTVTKISTSSLHAIRSKVSEFGTAGGMLTIKLASGISGKKSAVLSAVQVCVTTAAMGIRNSYSSFYSAGSYLVSGFAAGISDNSFKAAAKAAAMANAAEKAAREALDINSPSKVFRALGYSVPEGFAMGIDKLSGMVENSVTDMTDGALFGVKDSISKLANVINTDIDAQPTIRPVLDLSDVRSGAAAIGGMFNSKASVGVMANVGTISSMMNSRGQNGGNADVIAAINKLSKELGKSGGDSYQVNGVTYDDGSNIKNFAQAVIRQARIERRV